MSLLFVLLIVIVQLVSVSALYFNVSYHLPSYARQYCLSKEPVTVAEFVDVNGDSRPDVVDELPRFQQQWSRCKRNLHEQWLWFCQPNWFQHQRILCYRQSANIHHIHANVDFGSSFARNTGALSRCVCERCSQLAGQRRDPVPQNRFCCASLASCCWSLACSLLSLCARSRRRKENKNFNFFEKEKELFGFGCLN